MGEGPQESGAELGARLRAGDLGAAPATLNLLESGGTDEREQAEALLRAVSPATLGGEARAHVIGVTGPPGAGKSTLLAALVAEWRRRERSVAVLAVDPSSKRSGGALLGDRARIAHDATDRAVFIRSTAAGERIGGLARATRAGAQALAAAFDVVVVETVGVGQSETDVAEVADTVAVVVQPGAGDVLQFLKAGIMEIPDLLVVTKADMGAPAQAALRDVRAALGSLGSPGVQALAVCAVAPEQGIAELADAFDRHRGEINLEERRLAARRSGALADFIAEHGERGLRALGGRRAAQRWLADQDPGMDVPALRAALEAWASESA